MWLRFWHYECAQFRCYCHRLAWLHRLYRMRTYDGEMVEFGCVECQKAFWTRGGLLLRHDDHD